tara:strand:- start:157 stop:426 length:270 start_codon:yes stop_codon:yes gene_type:complete
MDFLLGFGCILLQMQVTTLIVVICKKYPDAILGMAGAMIFIDAIIVLTWGLTLKHYVVDLNLFIGGLGLSIVSSLIDKIIRFIKMQKEL